MLAEMSQALSGINLRLLPERCCASWSKSPNGSEDIKIELGGARIGIVSSLIILGHEIAFRMSSDHCFDFRLKQAWKTARANAPLLRSTSISRNQRFRLLQAFIKPSLLYGVEVWKLTADFLGKS